MKKPKMILFDYGQTIIEELYYHPVDGFKAIMKYLVKNKYNKSPEEVCRFADELNREFGLYDIDKMHTVTVEVHNRPFSNYLFEYLGLEFSISMDEIEKIFWDNAAPPKPIDGIKDFLKYFKDKNIRTGVISNISISGNVFKERINRLLPENNFEFIIPSSEYVFRKPSRRIFDLALKKADLKGEDVWFCGDQVKCDIEGAKSAGMQPVWFKGHLNFKQQGLDDGSYIEIKSWDELIRIIDNVELEGM